MPRSCVKSQPVKAGLMTLSSVAVNGVIVGTMYVGLCLTGPRDPNAMTAGQGIIIGLAVLVSGWFPMWVPSVVEDYIDGL